MRPLTAETIEMTRQGLLNSEWCGFSKRDTVNQLCDLALKGLAPRSETALRELPEANELVAIMRDARRYQWLKKPDRMLGISIEQWGEVRETLHSENADRAIDAAMAEEQR